MSLKLAIAGANGRMGRMVAEAAGQDAQVGVFCKFDQGDDVDAALAGAAVLIDFTRPEATMGHLAACNKHRVNLVIGTTGFSAEQTKQIENASANIAIVLAPNMSLGVSVTTKLVAMAAASLGMDADIEVFEAHHKMKVDAPSGTALMLGKVAAQARGQSFDSVAVYDRHAVQVDRAPGSIGFSSVRAGDIIGDHTVFFALNGERIEITHKSSSRATYAQGAVRAAKFLNGKPSGLFTMNDVLGF